MNYNDSYFDKLGETYNSGSDTGSRRLAYFLVNKFHPASSLDLGCAYGFIVRWLRHFGVQAYGADVSDYALNAASSDISSYLYQLDLSRDMLPLPDRSIELVTMLQLAEHIEDPTHILPEIKRVLTPGGHLFMTTPLPFIDSKLGQFVLGRGWKPLDVTHVNVYGRAYWKHLLKKAGFQYAGSCPDVISVSSPDYRITRLLAKLPGMNLIRSYIGGVYLFRSL